MKNELRKKAVALRRRGYTYGEIREVLPVSKGSLSIWLRDLILTDDELHTLAIHRRARIPAGRSSKQYWKKKREKVREAYNPPNDFQFALGLGLYWGEGSKYDTATVGMSNLDPTLLMVFVDWVRRYFPDDFSRVDIRVHHYWPNKDRTIRKWWRTQFRGTDVYVKKSTVVKKGRAFTKSSYGIANIRIAGKGAWRIRQKIEKALELLGT